MRYWKFGRRKTSDFLMHHGIQGQRWGIRNGPPYPLGSHPRKIFISGTSKFKGRLPKSITSKLDNYISNNYHILIGDAPGIDTSVQKYLARKGHKNVTVYTIEDKPRFMGSNDLGWGVKVIKAPELDIYALPRKDRIKASDENLVPLFFSHQNHIPI